MHSSNDNNNPVVVVLAAGQGQRFRASGAQTGKLQAQLHGRSVLEHTLAAVAASGLRAVLVENGPHWHSAGMGHSIARGVALSPDASGWLILPGDLPAVAPGSLRAVAQALQAQGGVVRPQVEGRWGHPVGFSAAWKAQLLQLTGDTGAQSIVRAAQAQLHVLALDDWGMLADTDTRADLAAVADRWTQRRV
ncbi:nucleotidyltransferase family protein [Acidovorax sp. CCYZU-2555]|uniref:nucleotidyltransferase family protein n=1 Tax=Acidovorax sp. CCYZU-2555 TaxID=2835042 RepID=UPI001BCCADD1|nr:nucleotidyltransferase family protein [Acidovorax sp. CCYZU-2555]MBS7776941.1 nucleotidyltransferase family protein [Acidovorax sp. CCYZU-2555]